VPGSGGERHARKNLANYFACVSGIDEQVGRILDLLKEQDLYENTIIVFTSDHGNCVGAHNHITKGNFYEESFGVPLIISWPEKIAHRRTELLFSPTDFFPTLAGLMDLDMPDVQGKDLSGQVISDTGYQHDATLYAYLSHARSDSLIDGFPGNAWGERGLRTKEYMLVVNKHPGQMTEYHLTDLATDPYQMNNVGPQNKDLIRAMLRDQLNPKLEEIGDEWYKIPVSKDGHYPPDFRAMENDAAMWDWRW
jgi:N-acetylglucosamine-6-sulfatase